MKHNIYSVYDIAAMLYQKPFVAGTHGEVTRSFADIVQDEKHPIGQHPEDYTLYSLGTFNDATGEITPNDPEKIATALELKALHRNRELYNDPEQLKAGGTE